MEKKKTLSESQYITLRVMADVAIKENQIKWEMGDDLVYIGANWSSLEWLANNGYIYTDRDYFHKKMYKLTEDSLNGIKEDMKNNATR